MSLQAARVMWFYWNMWVFLEMNLCMSLQTARVMMPRDTLEGMADKRCREGKA